MLIPSEHEGVKVVKCGHEIGGKVYYWVHFFIYSDILFDSGCPHTAKEVFEAFKDKKAVLITHYHEDHSGGAIELQKVMKAYAPKKSLEILKNPPEVMEYRKMVWGQPLPVYAKPLDELPAEFGVETIENPKHSFDHVSFLIDKKLFCGDLVISRGQTVCLREKRLLKTIESLRRILKYYFDFAYTANGVLSREEVEDYLAYLEELREKAERLYKEGKSIDEIVNALFPNPPQMAFMMEAVSEKEWARENIVMSLLNLL
ncbi:MAG: MBL fold metallo-hydrolase [Archaeoglobaceae archaeon]|nr:MBL fold metallo-hydrolase [Archaeoglobaceae archaeon]MDW8127979.1 MBL fold metallo-hydrolase [Archaeoglobaceae archaeon]